MRTITAVVSCDDCLLDGPIADSIETARRLAIERGFLVGIPHESFGWRTGETVDYCGPCAIKRRSQESA